MKFRPCIDLHNGHVKQIVGSTLEKGCLEENFISQNDAAFYASMFARDNLYGGHVIMLGPGNEAEALSALKTFPGGFQAGGGINTYNAESFLENGASHVIVTSALFSGNRLDISALKALGKITGTKRLVIDLSCVLTENGYFVAKDRWKTITEISVTTALLCFLEEFCSEFLIHAVSSEGKKRGADEKLVSMLAEYTSYGINPVTYAGGISSLSDISRFSEVSGGTLDFTVGSALDIYGGTIPYRDLLPGSK